MSHLAHFKNKKKRYILLFVLEGERYYSSRQDWLDELDENFLVTWFWIALAISKSQRVFHDHFILNIFSLLNSLLSLLIDEWLIIFSLRHGNVLSLCSQLMPTPWPSHFAYVLVQIGSSGKLDLGHVKLSWMQLSSYWNVRLRSPSFQTIRVIIHKTYQACRHIREHV